MLSVAWLTAFTCALTIMSYPPLIDEMIGALGMSFSEAGLLMSLTTLTQMSFTFVGGVLSDRIGTKKAMGIGIVILASSQIASGLVNTFPLEAVTRLLLGMGVGIAIVNVIKSVAEWFPSRELAMAESIQATGWAVGNVISFATAIPLSLALGMGWKGTFLTFGIVGAAMVLIFLALARERRSPRATEGHHESGKISDLLKIRELWLITIGMGGAFSGTSIVLTWLPKSLMDAGWSAEAASLVATTVPLLGIPANISGGTVSDKLGLRKPLIAASAIFLSLSYGLFSLATQGPLVWAAAALSGWFGYFFVGPLLAIPSELPEVGHGRSGTFFGIMQTLAGVAGFLTPIVAGWMRETTGSFTSGFILAAITPIFMLVPGILARETGWKGKLVKEHIQKVHEPEH